MPTDGYSTLIRRIEEAIPNCPNVDVTRLTKENKSEPSGSSNLTGNPNVIGAIQKPYKVNQAKGNTSPNPVKSWKKPVPNCNRCHKKGHWTQDCWTQKKPFCQYHKSTGHTTANCRDKNRDYNRFKQYRPPGAVTYSNYSQHTQTNNRQMYKPPQTYNRSQSMNNTNSHMYNPPDQNVPRTVNQTNPSTMNTINPNNLVQMPSSEIPPAQSTVNANFRLPPPITEGHI